MDYKRREEIISKDTLTVQDIIDLLDVDYNKACEVMRTIKDKSDRLSIRGKCHIQDYLDYFNLDTTRYTPNKGDKL